MPYYTQGTSFVPQYDPVFRWTGSFKEGEEREFTLGSYVTESTHPFIFEDGLSAKLISRHKKLHDFFNVGPIHAVSSKFKNELEALEPGIHQFFKIDLYDRAGNLFEDEFYLFNIITQIDAIIEEKSSLKRYYSSDGTKYSLLESGDEIYRCLSLADIDRKIIWTDRRSSSIIYISDLFFAVYKKQKMKGFSNFQFASAE